MRPVDGPCFSKLVSIWECNLRHVTFTERLTTFIPMVGSKMVYLHTNYTWFYKSLVTDVSSKQLMMFTYSKLFYKISQLLKSKLDFARQGHHHHIVIIPCLLEL
jgi:hypothetical protein